MTYREKKSSGKRRRRSSVLYVKQDFLDQLHTKSETTNDPNYTPVGWQRANDGQLQRRKQRTLENNKYRKNQRSRNRNRKRRNRNFKQNNYNNNNKNNQNKSKNRVWKKKGFEAPPKPRYKNKENAYQVKFRPTPQIKKKEEPVQVPITKKMWWKDDGNEKDKE